MICCACRKALFSHYLEEKNMEQTGWFLCWVIGGDTSTLDKALLALFESENAWDSNRTSAHPFQVPSMQKALYDTNISGEVILQTDNGTEFKNQC
jgi:hypothetical protein